MKKIKKALVIDWLDKYAGSERVISSFTKQFEFKSCYTLINLMSEEDLGKTFSNKPIKIIQTNLYFFKSKFRYLFFTFHKFIKSLKVDRDINLIISSSHCIAKGIYTNNNQLHISYFQARNQKHIWDDANLYFGRFRYIFHKLITFLRKKDVELSQRPNYIISNSNFVKDWVKKTYNRDSQVIYPPVETDKFPLEENKEDYYVAVGRLEKYKRFDLLVETFNQTDKNLVIIGDGSQMKELKKKSNKNILFLGYKNSEIVKNHISKAKAFIHIGIEDFGIAPVEAQSCGTPIIAYKAGGLLETVLENETGIFFEKQKTESILNAIKLFETKKFDPKKIRQNALRFSTKRFEKEFKNFVEQKTEEFFN